MPAENKEQLTLRALTAIPKNLQPLQFLRMAGKALPTRMELIRKSNFHGAFYALCLGAMLRAAKAALKDGNKKGAFMRWIGEHVPEKSYRTLHDYSLLAWEFAVKSKLTPDEAVALFTLKPGKAKSPAAKSAQAKLDAFIGDRSLHELMITHGVRGVGLKSDLTAGDGAPAQLTAAEQAQMELDLVWSQAWEPAKSLADLLAEKAATLKPEQREALEAELKKALQALRSA